MRVFKLARLGNRTTKFEETVRFIRGMLGARATQLRHGMVHQSGRAVCWTVEFLSATSRTVRSPTTAPSIPPSPRHRGDPAHGTSRAAAVRRTSD